MLFQIDESRLARQLIGIEKWGKTGKGTLKHIMGFGKTYEGIQIIKKVLLKGDVTIRIVVPSDYIRINWLRYLEEYNLLGKAVVYTANQIVVSKIKESVDL